MLEHLKISILNTKSSGGINGPTVNLYLDLPASPQLEEIFPAFIDAALRITFDTPFMGQGRFFIGFTCTNCRGINHPSGLCFFEKISGWDAVTRPAHVEAAMQAATTAAATSARNSV